MIITPPVQGRVNIAALHLSWKSQFARLALGWHLGASILGGFPRLPEKNGSLWLNCLCKQYCLCWTPDFLLESKILARAKQRVPTWLILNKIPRPWVYNKFPWETAFFMYCHNSLLGELITSCVNPPGEEPWKLTPGFLQTLSMCLFPLLIMLCIHSL